jgi:hypothetical protein
VWTEKADFQKMPIFFLEFYPLKDNSTQNAGGFHRLRSNSAQKV